MNSQHHPADDPRLTAYALGELDPAEHAEVEELLAQSKAAREAVDEILAVSGLLVDELRQQPVAELSETQRDAIYQQAAEVVASNNNKPPQLTVTKVPTAAPARSPGQVRSRSWVAVVATCASLVAVLVLGALIANNELPLTGNQSEFNSGTEITFDFGTDASLAKNEPLDPVTNDQIIAKLNSDPYKIDPTKVAPGDKWYRKVEEPNESKSASSSKPRYVEVQPAEQSSKTSNVPQGWSQSKLNWEDRKWNFKSKNQVRSHNRSTAGQGSSQQNGQSGEGQPTPAQRVAGGQAGSAGKSENGQVQTDVRRTIQRMNRSQQGSTALGVTPRIIVQEEERLDLGVPVTVKLGQEEESKQLGKVVVGRALTPENSSKRPYIRGHHFILMEDWDTPSSQSGESKFFGGTKLTPSFARSRRMAELPDFSNAYAFEYEVNSGSKVRAVMAEGQLYLVNVDKKTISSFPKDKPEELQQAREAYAKIIDNRFVSSNDEPLSTFSIDVDTASYTNVRRFLNNGQLPPADAVRIEEMVNYFKYDHEFAAGQYVNRRIKTEPFEVALEVGPAPWKTNHHLVRVAVQGHAIPTESRPASQLVFLIDVSGSMKDANKLPLVKQGLRMLVDQMGEDDRIGIVTYSNNATVLQEPINGGEKSQLWATIDSLQAQGSTNGAAVLQMAYDLARQFEDEKTTRRVIVCTDGDFNVGISDDKELVAFIKKQAEEDHIFLSVFGFGTGNIKDSKLEQIADHGNGHYAYVDGFGEAKRVFVEELTGTLFTLAKDVKIQVEFNPAVVAEYRLIGYENRALAAADFNNDKKDGGELGAGQSVVALYEVVPTGVKRSQQPGVDKLKYQTPKQKDNSSESQQGGERKESSETQQGGENRPAEMLTLKIRYKAPDGQASKKIERVLNHPQFSNLLARQKLTNDFHWSASVAALGMLLRHSEYCNNASYDQVLEWAGEAVGEDSHGRRKEMIGLIEKARKLQAR